jgi:NADPH:quinone reductase-like Zn-dependent oxidoreductase
MATSVGHQAKEDQPHSSMMAWRVHEFGPPNVMRFEQVLRPTPGPSEVLVKVEGAGVGPWDGWIRAGKSALPQPLPLTLGSDLSDEIVAVGPGVSGLRVGDQVYGVTNPQFIGAYAEYALAFAAMVSRKPTSLTYIEAASVPVICRDAMHAPVSHEEARHTPSRELVTAPAITYWQYGVEGRSTSRSKAVPVRFSWKKVAKGAMKILPLLSQFK